MWTPCVLRMVMSSPSLFRKSSAERGRWTHHTTGLDENLLHGGIARYYGVKQSANLASGWAGVSRARASQRHNTAHGVGHAARWRQGAPPRSRPDGTCRSSGTRRHSEIPSHDGACRPDQREWTGMRMNPGYIQGFMRGKRTNAKRSYGFGTPR